MKEHITSLAEAEENLAAAATYLTENIGSSDGHAEAMSEIVAHYISQGEVDLAAELADTIKDNFVRDNLLVKIAEKCAADGDDEYAFQLAEAIEEQGLKSAAIERISVQQAIRADFKSALKTAAQLAHPDDALAAIAVRQMINGEETEFRQTFSRIEYPASKIQSLQMTASHFYSQEKGKKASVLLAEAENYLDEIELPEEKIRLMMAIAGQYIEAAQFEQAVEISGKAKTAAEVLQSSHREGFLSTISLDFLRAENLDLADLTLDLIKDKTQIAATLTAFAAEFERQGEKDEALATLAEAHTILKSQKDKEIQDSRSRFSLFSSIAVRFARLGQIERALETALENPVADEHQNALLQIAVVCADQENDDAVQQSIKAIADNEFRAYALINISDVEFKKERKSEAVNLLNEAHNLTENISRPAALTNLLNEIAKRFYEYGETEKAREAAAESFQAFRRILDESHRAVAFLRLAEIYESCKFELNEAERLEISTMLRKAEW